MTRLALLPVLILTAACQSTRSERTLLATLRTVPVSYSACVAAAAGEVSSAKPAENAPARVKDEDEAAGDPLHVDIECRYVSVSARDVSQLVDGVDAGVFGRVVTRAAFQSAADAWEASGRARTVSDQSLSVLDGSRATMMVARQEAFVQAFEIKGADNALVGDPRIAVVHTGLDFDAQAKITPGGAGIELELSLKGAYLVGPLEQMNVRFPGSTTQVGLQIPIVFDENLITNVELARDEVLIIGGLSSEDGTRRILACISACRHDQDGVAIASR